MLKSSTDTLAFYFLEKNWNTLIDDYQKKKKYFTGTSPFMAILC